MRRLALAAVAALLFSACGSHEGSSPGTLHAPAIEVAASQDGRATLTWAAVPAASSYDLYWSPSAEVGPGNGTRVAGVTSPYTLTGLQNGSTYHVVIVAVKGTDEATSLAVTVQPMTAPAPLEAPARWWTKNTVFEHVWVSAFQDGDAPGQAPLGNTGNLRGITAALQAGYFTDLGVNALWLSPVFGASSLTAASGNKHGYDTTDYMNVATLYGSNQDLSDLVSAAHARGIRVIFDLVPNHTGSTHPWFLDSDASVTSPYRDWYVWDSHASPTYPGDYAGEFWHAPTDAGAVPGFVYFGFFNAGMPDLNYENPEVTAMIHGVVKSWFDFGLDGIRVDAVRNLREGTTASTYLDQPSTHAWFDGLRAQVIDAYASGAHPKMMMAEDWVGSVSQQQSWVRNASTGAAEFNVALDFIEPWVLIDAINRSGGISSATASVSALRTHLVTDATTVQAAGGTLGVFQNNHDLVASRPVTSYGGQGPQLYLAAALNFLGQGMPILYYGNEIAMPGSFNGGSGPDTNMRQPFDWTVEATLAASPDSIWRWHQALIHLRTGYGAWSDPSIASLTASDPGVFAFRISSSGTGKSAVVVANLNGGAASFTVPVSATSLKGLLGGTAGDAFTAGTLTVTALPGFGVRVYAVDDPGATTYLDHDPVRANYNPTLTLPPPAALYLRGTVTANGWGTCNAVNLLQRSGTSYQLSVPLAAGTTYQFKFADASWGDYNYGQGNVSWASGHPQPTGGVSGSAGGNLTFTPGAAGTYTFNFQYGQSASYWIE